MLVATSKTKTIAWPHAPTHHLSSGGTYIVTAGTYQKHHFFREAANLEDLQRELLNIAQDFSWQLEAWAIFSNHYHFVAHSPEAEESAKSLSIMLGQLHERTAKQVNKRQGIPGRKVWHNFWETKLTYEKSYLARLNYVHHNPVKHGLVAVPNQYPWCSARWFEKTATAAQIKTIYGFKLDKVQVFDEYDAASEW